MRLKKFSGSCGLLMAGFLSLCTGLTGCENRQEAFLLEEKEEAAEETAPGKTEEASADAGNVSGEEGPKGRTGAEEKQPEEAVQQKTEIYVDVCGAVAHPGVFALEEGSRVFQAIEAAGGYLPGAAGEYVNRARSLTDGQQLYIPTEEEVQEWAAAGQEGVTPGLGAEVFEGGVRTSEGAGQASEGRINLNTADEAALTTLAGIGPSKAQAIIVYREENGPFSSIEDIMNVQGIKEGTFAKIKDYIEVG